MDPLTPTRSVQFSLQTRLIPSPCLQCRSAIYRPVCQQPTTFYHKTANTLLSPSHQRTHTAQPTEHTPFITTNSTFTMHLNLSHVHNLNPTSGFGLIDCEPSAFRPIQTRSLENTVATGYTLIDQQGGSTPPTPAVVLCCPAVDEPVSHDSGVIIKLAD